MALYQVENALSKRSSDERQGLELSGKKNDDLFFIDKVQLPVKERWPPTSRKEAKPR